jgi:hypothetical protein
LFTASSAYAAGSSRSNTPEYYYQPNVGNLELAARYDQQSASLSSATGTIKTADINFAQTGLGIEAGYGLSEAWAVRASIASLTTKEDMTDLNGVTSSAKASGLNDFTVGLTNITALSAWNLNVGISAALSPAKKKDLVFGGAEGNEMSGGTAITNYVGLSTIIGASNYFGFKAGYTGRTERTVSDNAASPSDYRITGGNSVLVGMFIETQISDFAVDARAEYSVIDPSLNTYANTTTKSNDGYKILTVGVGAQYQLSAMINFRLEYTLAMYSDQLSGTTTTPAFSVSDLGARLRFEF